MVTFLSLSFIKTILFFMETASIKKNIQRLFPLFDQLELVDELAKNSQYMELPPKTELLNSDSYIKVIPLVLSGSVKVSRTDESGREIFLYYIQGGESCAITLSSCLKMEKSTIRAVVQENTALLAIPVEVVYDVNKRYPSWHHFVFDTFSKRFDEVLTVLENVVFHNMDERLVKHLIDKALTLNTKVLHISHQEIANDLATSREVISRLLKQFEKKGFVQLSRGKITIKELLNSKKITFN